MQIDITHNGITFVGTYESEAETGPTYGCGGTPASESIEIESCEVDDPADPGEFLEDLRDRQPVTASVTETYIAVNGCLPPGIKRWAIEFYRDIVEEELAYEGQNYEPDHGY